MSMKNVILDVDPGLDDAWSIFSMLWAERQGQIKVRAITTVCGNSTIENVAKNTLRILHAADRLDVPVYKGCSEPLILKKYNVPASFTSFHFNDGLGDIDYNHEPDMEQIRTEHAVNAIYDIIKTHTNVSLMCLGPLTNLAMLLKLYPGISEKFESIWIMGGNSTGVGNVTNSAEFNFHCDPEAAFISFERIQCPTYLLPLETIRFQDPLIPFEWRYETVGMHRNKITDLMDPIEKKCYGAWCGKHWECYDAVVAACFINPKCITKVTNYHATVELGGFLTRGQVVLDHRKDNAENVKVIQEYDVEIFKTIILETVKASCRN